MAVQTAGAIPVSTQAEKARQRRWWGVGAFAVGTISDNMEGGLINTLFPVIMGALGLEVGALGVLSSISKWARMIFGPAWAMVADRTSRKWVLVLVTGIWGLWTAACGFAQNYSQLLILYAIAAVGTVAAEPIQNGLLTDMFGDDERGKAYGSLRSIGTIGGLFLTPLIGQLAAWPTPESGWRIGFFIMAGTSLLSGILIALFLVEPPRTVAAGEDPNAGKFQLKDVGTILKIPTVLLLAVNLLFITSLVLLAFMVTYFVRVRGWTTQEAAILYTVFMAGWGISSFLGGSLGDIFEKKFGPRGRVMLMQMYLGSFAVMTFLMMQINWGHTFLFYVVIFLTGLVGSIGFSGCVLPMVSMVVEPKYAGTAFALLFSFIQGGITAIMLLLIGPLSKALGGLQSTLFWLVSVPYAINAVFWFVFYGPFPKDVARAKARIAGQKV